MAEGKTIISTGTKIISGFALSFIILFLAGYLSFDCIFKLKYTINDLGKPNLLLENIRNIKNDLDDAENIVHMYTYSNHQNYFNSYQTIKDSLGFSLLQLKNQYVNDPVWLNKVDSVQLLVEQKMEILDYLVQLHENKLPPGFSFEKLKRRLDTIKNELEKPLKPIPPIKSSFFKSVSQLFDKTDSSIGGLDSLQIAAAMNQMEVAIINTQQQQLKDDNRRRDIQIELFKRDLELKQMLGNMIDNLIVSENAFVDYRKIATNQIVKETLTRLSIIIILSMLMIMLLAARILSDIKKSEKTKLNLEEARRQAEGLTLVKAQFLANMSHEIRTPLSAIIGFTEQLLRSNPNSDQQKYAQIIASSSEHLLEIVNEVLTFSKIEAGKIQIENLNFNLKFLIEEVQMLMEIKALEKELNLYVKIDDTADKLFAGDPLRFKQIIINLVSNAIKFTEKGNITVSCKLSAVKNEQVNVIIDVSDTGIGISKDKLHSIFFEFTQAHSSINRTTVGTGLGLTISKRLSVLMGGDISVKSTLGMGSVFTLKIPLDLAKPSLTTQKNISRNMEVNYELIKSKNVLLVDDDDMNLMLGKIILEQLGVNAQFAKNGKEALTKVIEQNFDIIFMDIHMPEMNGMEVTRKIRDLETHNELSVQHIVALTANVMHDDIKEFINSGMDDYLTKPFREKDIYLKIVEVLNLN